VSNNYEDLAEFKKFSKLELPRLVRNQLETEFSLEEDLKCKLISTVQQCHELLFSEYDAARRPSQTPSADSITPSHYRAERGTADESRRSIPTRQVSDQLAPISRLLPPQRDFDSSSMQGGSNLATIVNEMVPTSTRTAATGKVSIYILMTSLQMTSHRIIRTAKP